MADDFRVLPQDVQDAATSCDATANEVQAQLQELKSYVQGLEAEWNGIASQTFAALMTDYDIFSTMLENALRDIGSGLRGNYVNYTDAEDANIRGLTSVHGTIPGAHFR
ncbi:WXG100 family type VII secretion target [Streptomyces sp. NBC_01136]|uniref:WXG100 family type VII secretion target n=1 Tax=unclassified Streptomyces TaxID=2593676 RepID=UPI00324FD1C6|nr:WXG100 family type VII secretion target [Streptomyces sp. NBC_01136]